MGKKKGQLMINKLIIWFIVIVLFVSMVVAYFILIGKGGAALDYLKSLFRFGR